MTVIIAEPEATPTAPAYVLPSTGTTLRRAADILGALSHPRVSPVDLQLALRDAADLDYYRAEAALVVFGEYLDATTGDDRWPYGWAGARSREDVAAELRAAAEHADDEQAGAVSRG